MSELMDDDGENQAVRMFLLGYGAGGTVKAMREHLEMAGFDKHWPDWVEAQDGHLTKAGAQDWLRYLFGLEHNALKEHNEHLVRETVKMAADVAAIQRAHDEQKLRLYTEIRSLKALLTVQVQEAQSKIDWLMLEYCPEEMTDAQVANWAKHQQAVQVCPECDMAGCRHIRTAISAQD